MQQQKLLFWPIAQKIIPFRNDIHKALLNHNQLLCLNNTLSFNNDPGRINFK